VDARASAARQPARAIARVVGNGARVAWARAAGVDPARGVRRNPTVEPSARVASLRFPRAAGTSDREEANEEEAAATHARQRITGARRPPSRHVRARRRAWVR